MKDFKSSIIVTIVCVAIAYFLGANTAAGGFQAGLASVLMVLILGLMEISLSFDNAVVNASVLKDMDSKWQFIFLTWGMVIAVFGMRLLFPIVIVSMASGLGLVEVSQMAINNVDEYAKHLEASHSSIAAFGGMFLLLVFLNFMIDEAKELHWIAVIEQKLAHLGKLDSFAIMASLLILFLLQHFLPIEETERFTVLAAGVAGVVLYTAVSGLDGLFENEEAGEAVVQTVKRAGAAAFLYLEVLDASFSFDGVIGAFAITRELPIIMLGLGVGAMFVRSLTVYLVNKGTLDEYVFLSHGAHWAIGALAAIMLASIVCHVNEVFTGTVGMALIVLSVISSIRYNRQHKKQV